MKLSKLALVLEPDTADFAPGLLAIQESPPGRMPMVMAYSLGTLFVILVLWAIFGKLDIVASAEGRLVPQTYIKIVQPADAGIVRDILVTEGAAVSAGQVLMRMDTKLADADAKTIRNEMQLKSLQLRRITAELNGSRMAMRKDDPPLLYAQIDGQYQAHRQAYQDALDQESATLERARHDLESSREILSKLQQTVPSYQKTADAYEKLAAGGFFSPLASQEKVRDKIEKEQDLLAQASTVAGLQAAIDASGKKLAQITSNYRSQLQNERVEIESQYQKLQQEWAKIEHKSELLELKASQAGIVKDLAIHTQGSVVSPGSVVMILVPHDEPLQAEILVKNEDVGFVFPGQKVKLKLSAYPFQKYGMLDGTVLHVGADALEESAQNKVANTPQPSSYKALVQLDSQQFQLDDERLKLAAGMQVVAEIHQGKRTVLEYLLSPVQKAFTEAARER